MKIQLVSEVYPPRAGGAGWSSRALALGLRRAGHSVSVLTTSPGPPDLDGLPVTRLTVRGRKRLAIPRAFAACLHDTARTGTLLHAQHSLSALGTLAGDHASRVAVTVRDHWPVCFWSTRISRGALCPGCGLAAMTRCVEGHVRLPWALSWGALPYMQADLWAKRRALRRAGAVLAVSDAVAEELRTAGLSPETLPNIVDAEDTRVRAQAPPSWPLPERYLLFIGKLEDNKGARLLVPAVAAARTQLPLVVLGEGALAHTIRFDATALGVDLHQRGWADRDDVLRVMARAQALVFPSLWPEPLSRVLLEALALGTPVAAMATGGTREILEDGVSGLLATDAAGLSAALARLVDDVKLQRRISEGARARAEAFSPETLIPRYEDIYRRLL